MWLPALIVVLFSFCKGQTTVNSEDFQECGRSSPVIESVENGEARLGEFPHMCVMYAKINTENIFLGGASIIQSNQLLTLATAVSPVLGPVPGCGGHQLTVGLTVRCGAVDLQAPDSAEGGTYLAQDREVQSIFIHPGYSNTSLTNDFAILLLEKPLLFTPQVGRVCLPSPSWIPQPGRVCQASGHGKAAQTFDPYSPSLGKVDLPLWEMSTCEETLNSQHFSSTPLASWQSHPSQLCAGGEEEKDTCEGDGGGPLVCQQEKISIEDKLFGTAADLVDLRTVNTLQFVQVGVIAWGIGCGSSLPGVYSKVSHAMCWIDQIMSCHPAEVSESEDALDIDLRVTDPASYNSLSETECGIRSATPRDPTATCNCLPSLISSDDLLSTADQTLFDLRSFDK